jgi:hypothetical protein
MPSSTDQVSLVPLTTAKAPRKHRPGFRPVAKSKKKSSANAKTVPEDVGNAVVAAAETNDNEESRAEENLTFAERSAEKETPAEATVDSSQKAADSSTTSKAETLVPVTQEATNTKQKSPHGLHVTFAEDSRDDNDRKSASAKQSTQTAKNGKTVTTQTPSSAATPSSPRRSSRKRKQNVPSSIQIGVTRETASSSLRGTETETSRQEKQQNAAVAAAASAVAAASHTDSTAIVTVSQDRDILDRLRAEQDQGPKLTSFCSEYKNENKETRPGKRRKKKQNQQGGNEEAAGTTADTGGTEDGDNVDAVADVNDDATNQPAAPAGVPVIQIIDGEIVLQESSLMLPTRRTVKEVEEEFQDNIVEEDAQLAIVQASYNSFITKGDAAANGGKRGPKSWSVQDTHKFFVALRQLGTDFGSMEAYFDNKRSRRQLKQKYRRELRKNPMLIEELALNPKYKTEIDMSAFDVEVDPKRVEAFENEEPPPYEPTELEEPTEKEVSSSNANDPVQNEGREGGEMQEIVEDAIEEKRKQAEAAASAIPAKTISSPGTHSSRTTKYRAGKKQTQEKSNNSTALSSKVNESFASLWPDNWNGGDENPASDPTDNFVDAGMDQVMEEFFDIQTFGVPIEKEQLESTGKSSSNKDSSTPEPPSGQNDLNTVPLVPKKKAASKSQRPKIRPSLRKKKK